MVLQQAPSSAALYGSVPDGSPKGVTVSLQLNSSTGYSKTFSTSAFTVTESGTQNWKILLDPMTVGGDYTASLSCASCAGSPSSNSVTIKDITFGDVWLCTGQSNAWLPLWFTFERNETTANVALGKYDNLRLWRGGLGKVGAPSEAGNWVLPSGPEPGSDSNDALTDQWRHPKDLLPPNYIRDGEPWFWEFPSTCFYTASYLTDLMVKDGKTPPPIGIMTTPVGGTMIEEWTDPATQSMCRNVTCMCQDQGCDPYQPLGPNCTGNSDLWYGNSQPYVNITLKMFLWYQSENNLQYDGGNSAQGTGYACMFPAMIQKWREVWSAVPGTTDPMAPFGFVTLADGVSIAFLNVSVWFF